MNSGVPLPGLDGSSPLAFMAALGVLRALDDRARGLGLPAPRMAWQERPPWIPVVLGLESMEAILDALEADRASWTDEPALCFAYTKAGERASAGAPGAVRDLKPRPAVMRAFLEEVAERAARGERRSARQAAAYGTDVARDGSKGNTKPTALHFTAGQQTFLGAVADLQRLVSRAHLQEALEGPWRAGDLRSLGWDPLGATSARPYALRARNPSGEKRPCVPGVEWLAFVGLAFFATAPRGAAVYTTCVSGRWKDAALTWPLWTCPAAARTVESLLRTRDLAALTLGEREARGIGGVLSCSILRSEQGGYGSFSPSRML